MHPMPAPARELTSAPFPKPSWVDPELLTQVLIATEASSPHFLPTKPPSAYQNGYVLKTF